MRYLLSILLLCGFAQCQHSNSLSWTAPAVSAPVVISSFNVYRGTTPGGYKLGTPYAKVTAPSYVDLAVKAGDSFYYVVSVVCSACSTQESGFSAEVRAVTPADSQPPAISGPGFVVVSR